MGAGLAQPGDGVFTDAAVGEDFEGWKEAAEFRDAGAGSRVEITALDAHLGSHDEDAGDARNVILDLDEFGVEVDGEAGLLAALEDIVEGGRDAFAGFDWERDTVDPGVEEGGQKVQRPGGHEVEVELDRGEGAEAGDQGGKEEKRWDEMAIACVEVEGAGRGRKAAEFGFEVGEVGRPDGDIEQQSGHAAMLPFEKKMMKPLMLLALAGIAAYGQGPIVPNDPDPVVVSLNGKGYRRTELEALINAVGGGVAVNYRANKRAFLEQLALTLKLEQIADEKKIPTFEPYKSRLAYNRTMLLATAMMSEAQRDLSNTAEDQAKYYAEHKAEFSRAQTKIIYLPFPPVPEGGTRDEEAVKKTAEDLVKRARAGEPFVELVKKYSEDADSKAKDGDFPPFNPADESLPAPVKTIVFGLKPGEVSDGVRQANGYYVFRLEKFIVPELDAIRNEVYMALQREQFDKWMADVRKSVQVEVKDEKFLTEAPPAKR